MKDGEYTHTATAFDSKTPYLQVGQEMPNMFCRLFEIDKEEWEKTNKVLITGWCNDSVCSRQ